ncbi:MAG: hypothetical protein V7661_01355 [Sulfitobacter sp.]
MSDILVAADENTATDLVTAAVNTFGALSSSGTDSLGPLNANWTAGVSFIPGGVSLREPDIVRLSNMQVNFSASVGISIDLNDFLPDFCLPRICIRIPFVGRVCTPEICIDWPTINLPTVSHSGNLNFTSDFRALTSIDGSDWKVEIEIVNIPNLSLDAFTTVLIAGLVSATALALLAVPFIGPFLALATVAIGAIFTVAALTGLLGPILSLFLSGLAFEIYKQPRVQEILPANGLTDPQVAIRIDSLGAAVESSDEDELVLTADISPA